MENFKSFLQEKLSHQSAAIHLRNIEYFLVYLEYQALDIEYCNTILIHDYLLSCRKKGWTAPTIQLHLSSIRYYLDFCNIQPNPALAVRLEKRQKTVPHGLWSVEEISELYQHYPQEYQRNKVVLGLLCFQALRKSEMQGLKIQDIKWKKQQIIIPKYKKVNGRTLGLQEQQIQLLNNFCKGKKKAVFKDKEVRQALNSLYVRFRKQNFNFGFHRLRASVYTNWLKKYNLRQVQYMAGHRYVSSTERYQTQHLEDLQIELEKYYPLQDD